jgi:hypothetical protein
MARAAHDGTNIVVVFGPTNLVHALCSLWLSALMAILIHEFTVRDGTSFDYSWVHHGL